MRKDTFQTGINSLKIESKAIVDIIAVTENLDSPLARNAQVVIPLKINYV